MKNKKGITLIALVITIVVLIILAGVVINLTLSNNSILDNVKKSTTEYEKAQIKEKLEIEIVNIQTKKIENGENFIREDLLELNNIGATMETVGIPAEGEYKDYFFEIDENYNVTVVEKLKGEKPKLQGEIITTGIIVEGDKVEIKVTAKINKGTITSIEATNGAVLKTDISTTEKVFEVSSNGTYYFRATADNGMKSVVGVRVNTMIEKPIIEIKDITDKALKIKITNEYEEGLLTEYKYYVNDELKNSGTTNLECIINDLYEDTTYNIFVEAYLKDIDEPIKSNIETTKTLVASNKLYLINNGIVNEELTGGWDGIPYYGRETGKLTPSDGFMIYSGSDAYTLYKKATKNSVNWNGYTRIKLEAMVYGTLYQYSTYGQVCVGIAKAKGNYTTNWATNNNLYMEYIQHPAVNSRINVDCILGDYVENTYPFFGIHRCNIYIYNMYLY